ncbi:hypothetical protein PVAP13_9NG312156 [Panicum virgatum]|uniref:Uncharacterized protein n=1 Tax=Panicum virgatum TaxID=38727 RepID=A0A8T0MP19_PANVG|nr:hypothetical protein PVAP13_9NG312156 [Panicum virgatum]
MSSTHSAKITAGRPAAGRPGPAAPLPGDRPPVTCAQFSHRFFFQKCPCRPAAERPGPSRLAVGRPGYIPFLYPSQTLAFLSFQSSLPAATCHRRPLARLPLRAAPAPPRLYFATRPSHYLLSHLPCAAPPPRAHAAAPPRARAAALHSSPLAPRAATSMEKKFACSPF